MLITCMIQGERQTKPMIITFSGKSAISAMKIAEAGDFGLVRGSSGCVNWGRNRANTRLNPDISNSTNKRRMRELFAENDVPMPKLYSVSDIRALPANWPCKFVGRPDQHTRGRGLWYVYDLETLAKALKGTRKKKAATHFMEYVDAPHEIRVHIFLGKSIRISEKKFADGGYTTIKPTVDIKQARKAAKKAVRALGLDFGAVDILVMDDGTPYVLEVNAAPGIGGSLPRLYAETFRKWYEDEA